MDGSDDRFQESLFQRHLFATPAVRHLAWLVYSRPLLVLDQDRDGAAAWPADVEQTLLELDRNPQPLLTHLALRQSHRLGLYFEQLYGYALTALLGQRVLAQNLPVRALGRTLGELDFLVHDPETDVVVHHEIAVKFYMGWRGEHPAEGGKPPGWYGPDSRDQLSRKLRHLLEHQIPMWRSEVGLACLQAEGLAAPQASQLGLYGYLFRHQREAGPALPAGISSPHPANSWRRISEPAPQPAPDCRLEILRKPHWLGPLQRPEQHPPGNGLDEAAMAEAAKRPILVAIMERTAKGFWLESGRQFVTPDHWCRAEG